MKNAIIICTRLESSRVPEKAIKEINGTPIIKHLVERLQGCHLPIIIATPYGQLPVYQEILKEYDNIGYFEGRDHDPLARLMDAALCFDVKNVVRVTHDKIFVDPLDVKDALDIFNDDNDDYLYGSDFIPGTGFEVIKTSVLQTASAKFKNVEHVSYAIKAITKNVFNFSPRVYAEDIRLLIDFPEDVKLMDTLMACLGNGCGIDAVLSFMNKNKWAKKVNKMPLVTIYTCAYNAETWITKAMGSVIEQSVFGNCEYILIDDHSEDRTSFSMSRIASIYNNVKYIRNGENVGLASSSNIALKEARGKYIVRLDADDYFLNRRSVDNLVHAMQTNPCDVIYPNNYYGSMTSIQSGSTQNHVGGAIFDTRAINHLKFTEKLRNHEGLDFFERAKSQLRIGYLETPIFFYRQHDKSMSKTNLEERSITKQQIESGAIHA